jgi:hypothetical protein
MDSNKDVGDVVVACREAVSTTRLRSGLYIYLVGLRQAQTTWWWGGASQQIASASSSHHFPAVDPQCRCAL